MYRKLTIILDEQTYRGLKEKVNRSNMSQFVAELIKHHISSTQKLEITTEEQKEADVKAAKKLGFTLTQYLQWHEFTKNPKCLKRLYSGRYCKNKPNIWFSDWEDLSREDLDGEFYEGAKSLKRQFLEQKILCSIHTEHKCPICDYTARKWKDPSTCPQCGHRLWKWDGEK